MDVRFGVRNNLRVSAVAVIAALFVHAQMSGAPIGAPIGAPPQACAASRISAREFNSGVSLFKRGEFVLAADVFKELLEKYPDAPQIDEVKYWFAETRDRLNDHPKALEMYKRIIAEHPESKFLTRAIFGAGYASYRLNQFQEASGYFTDAARKPDAEDIAGESLIMGAYCFSRLKQPARAEEILKELLAKPNVNPKYVLDARYELGLIFRDFGRDSEALDALNPVARNRDHSRQADAMLAIGDLLYKKGRHAESIGWYEKVLNNKQSTESMKARAQWNAAWSEMGVGDDTAAEKSFASVVKLETIQPEIKGDAWLRLAILSRRAGKETTAQWRAREALAIADTSNLPRLADDVRIFLAESEYLKTRYDSGLEILSGIRQPTYAFHQLKGQIYFDSRRFGDALGCFEQAVTAADDRAPRNQSYLDLAHTRLALKTYDAALAAAANIQDPPKQMALNVDEFYARTYMAMGKFKEAQEKYAEVAARKADPEGVTEAMYFSALASSRADLPDEAKSRLDKLFALNPPPGQFRSAAAVLLGDVLAKLGKSDAAVKQYRKAASEAEDSDVVYLAYTHLIESLLKKKNDPEAVAAAAEFAGRLPEGRTFLFLAEFLSGAKRPQEVLKYADHAARILVTDETGQAKAVYYAMAANYETKQYAAAAESLKRLTRYIRNRDPKDPMVEEAVFWDCRINQSEKDAAGARKAYQSYLERYPAGKYAADAQFNLGLLAFDAGELDDAEKQFQSVLGAKSPAAAAAEGGDLFVQTVYNLASARIARKDYAGAREMLSAIEKSPGFAADAGFRYKRGFVEMQLGQEKPAEELYAQVLRDTAAPRNIADRAIRALSDMYYRSDRFGDLIGLQEKEMDVVKDPEARAHVFYLVGVTYFNREQYETAAKMFGQVVKTPDTALQVEAALKSADCQYNLGNYARAYKTYESIGEKHVNTRYGDEAVYAMGLCKIKLGQEDEAIEHFENFLKNNPGSSMTQNVALEAAKLYFRKGLPDRALEKIEFIESARATPFKQEASRLRVKIAEKKNNPDEIFRETMRHTKLYGPEGDVVLVAVQASVAAGKYEETVKALEGVKMDGVKPEVADRLDFYRAESLRHLSRPGAEEIYQRLAGVADSEVRLSASYRYAGFLVDRGQAARAMDVLKPVLSDAVGFKFHEESILFGITASKKSGLDAQSAGIYEAYGSRLTEGQSKVQATEAYYSACLALNDKEKALKAAELLLGYTLTPRRRTELILSSASLNEDLNRQDKAQSLYDRIIADADAAADLKDQSLDRRIHLAMSRGAEGRQYLTAYLSGSPDPVRGRIVVEKLIADAMAEKRFDETIRLVELSETKLSKVSASMRYRLALAKWELADTAGALKELRILANPKSPDTYYAAWSALKLGEQDYRQDSRKSAESFLRQAWAGRENLSEDAKTSAYKMLADIQLASEDVDGMAFLAAQPAPAGAVDESYLIKGFAAFHAGDFASAAGQLKAVASKEARAKRIYAESLAASGDTPAALKELDDLAGTRGPLAAAAQQRKAQIHYASGNLKEALIHFYNVLDQYEPGENADVAPAAMLGIVQVQVRTGEPAKAQKTLEDMRKKYPRAKETAAAQKIVKNTGN